MPYSRTNYALVSAPELDRDMRNIGMRIGNASSEGPSADIEVTLASVVRDALPQGYRVLGVLMAWLERHHKRVNVQRLGRVLRQVESTQTELAIWAAIGHWLCKTDSRWLKFKNLYQGPRLTLHGDDEITKLTVARNGEDPRYVDSTLFIDAKTLRSRLADVHTVAQVAQQNSTYRARLIHGPVHRADVWAELDRAPERPVYQIAHVIGCAYETARSIAADWRLARKANVT